MSVRLQSRQFIIFETHREESTNEIHSILRISTRTHIDD